MAERRLSARGASLLAAAFGEASGGGGASPSAEIGGMGPSFADGGISIFNPRGSFTSDGGGGGGWDLRRGSLASDSGGAAAALAEGGEGGEKEAAPFAPPTVLLEGWLLMRGALVKNWKRRWVALCCGCHYEGLGLSWFDLGNENGQRGSADCIVELTEQPGVKPHAFSVRCRGVTGPDSWRELVLCAENGDDLTAWLGAIRENIVPIE